VKVFLFIRPAQVKTARASGGNLLTKGRRGMILQEGALAILGSALMAVVTISGGDRRIWRRRNLQGSIDFNLRTH
jgi:hypothetical protein